jgi:hypothetical protein
MRTEGEGRKKKGEGRKLGEQGAGGREQELETLNAEL